MRKRASFFFIVALFALSFNSVVNRAQESRPAGDAIRVDGGLISGGLSSDGKIVVYKGIPFAAPPVGPMRWKPPQPAKPWDGVRTCTDFGPSCPQPSFLQAIFGQKAGKMSEDCLYLNIWAPVKKPPARLSVMVWIHGGAYSMGSGSSGIYDGEALARQGVIVVTINYRLGPFGFFAHPLLSKESPRNSSGNYGLLDQIFALRWVKRNITAFGGDAGRVTIFGESAGAGSVCYLMASPLAKDLFHRAIAQSGSAFGPARHLRETWSGLEPMEKVGERIARDLGCDKAPGALAALRALPAEKLIAGSRMATNFFFGAEGNRLIPIVDGWVIPDDPAAVFEAGKHNGVPLIVGTNADEGTIFLLSVPLNGPEAYRQLVRGMYGLHADEVLTLYPAASRAEVRAALNKILTDSAFVTGARIFARTASKVNPRTFMYQFTRVRSDFGSHRLGAFHGSEIPYVFGNLGAFGAAAENQDRSLSRTMSAYWVRFATSGDPNSLGRLYWPAYTTDNDEYIEFGTEITVKSGLRKGNAELFERIAAERRAERK
jgi:para-nitrobenzyl esterase